MFIQLVASFIYQRGKIIRTEKFRGCLLQFGGCKRINLPE